MRRLKDFLLAIAAGICIAFGGAINLVCVNAGLKVVGGLLFSVGLLVICLFGFNLFTGKVGYLFEQPSKKTYLLDLLVFYVGNFVGAVGTGLLLRLTSFNSVLTETVRHVCEHKLVQPLFEANTYDSYQRWYGMLILAFFCGFIVFLAVDLFKRENIHPVLRCIGLILLIGTFVISGFEHCIADMFYLSVSGLFFDSTLAAGAWLSIIFGSSGNILGAFAAYLLIYKTVKK
jgi:formate/nitrite transporter FocA (FNT family)